LKKRERKKDGVCEILLLEKKGRDLYGSFETGRGGAAGKKKKNFSTSKRKGFLRSEKRRGKKES